MSMQVLCSVTYVADGLRVVVAGPCYGHDVLLECQMAVKHDTERLHLISTGRSTPATDTDDTAGVTARSWFAVPMISASDLSGLSCSPFCIYHYLTSLVHAVSTDSPSDVLSACMARRSCVSSAY